MSSSAPGRPRVVHQSATEGDRALMQERIRILGRTGALLSLVFLAVLHLLGRSDGGGGWTAQDVGILVVAAVYAGLWGAGRTDRLGMSGMRSVEASAAVLAGVGCAIHGWVGPDAADYRFDAILAVDNILVVRAVLLPSTVRRTVVVGLATLVPVLVPALVPGAVPWTVDVAADSGLEASLLLGWGVVALAVSIIVSWVVYDLRTEVRVARRLGRYQLEELVGSGAMGEVHRARHALLRRPTAIKLLRPGAAGEEAIARFEREVQLTSQLTHPNTVAIYDFGRTSDRIFYYAMEYLPGPDLQRLVEHWGPMPPSRVIHVLRQICGSLFEAHERGLVHRDVKAANVILCERGGVPDVVKVVDFGVVHTTSAGASEDVPVSRIVGTPAYLSPEAWQNPEGVNHLSDLYAVGVLGYQLATGTLPFDGDNLAALCHQHLFIEPERPSARVPEVPADLERVLLKCLAKEPAHRSADAQALATELDRCVDAGGWTKGLAAAWWAERGDRPPGAPIPGPCPPLDWYEPND